VSCQSSSGQSGKKEKRRMNDSKSKEPEWVWESQGWFNKKKNHYLYGLAALDCLDPQERDAVLNRIDVVENKREEDKRKRIKRQIEKMMGGE
jgi:hypothetical protein